ncbi:MAG: hypothetical protein MUP63_03730 [Candidatus Nanohaloarchaeota archaeon QJJ-7]|nr:hypothetical protein [Candidatus Nanohaloarchaeota archaeon QJJ-7]
MYCGILLSGSTDEDSCVAFLEEGAIETFSVETNDEIIELVDEKSPEIITLNASPERKQRGEGFSEPEDSEGSLDPETASKFREGEQELVEEGHSLLPQRMREKSVLERADHLSRRIEASGSGSQIIESNSRIVTEILDLSGDEELEDLGIETSDIETVWEYDAVVLAVVAKLYSDDRCEEHGIIVPEEGVESV